MEIFPNYWLKKSRSMMELFKLPSHDIGVIKYNFCSWKLEIILIQSRSKVYILLAEYAKC